MRTLTPPKRLELFQYIWGILKKKKCHLYRINGIEDTIHIATHLHPSVAFASLIKDIKLASSEHIKKSNIFPEFNGWQDGYGAFTYSIKEKDRLINYIMNHEKHHKKITFLDEFIALLKEHGIEFNEKYFVPSFYKYYHL